MYQPIDVLGHAALSDAASVTAEIPVTRTETTTEVRPDGTVRTTSVTTTGPAGLGAAGGALQLGDAPAASAGEVHASVVEPALAKFADASGQVTGPLPSHPTPTRPDL